MLLLWRLKLIRIVLVILMQSLFVRALYIQANGNHPLYLCLDPVYVAIAIFYCRHRMSRWPWLNTFHVYLTTNLIAEISLICTVFSGSQACVDSVFHNLTLLVVGLTMLTSVHTQPFLQSNPISSPVSCDVLCSLIRPAGRILKPFSRISLKSFYSVSVYLSVCSFCSARLHAWQQQQLISSAGDLWAKYHTGIITPKSF